MRRNLYDLGALAVVGILAIALFGNVAEATTTIDKGDLGTYQRHGRFVHRILSSTAEWGTSASPAANSVDRQVRYEKGDLGTWVRDGRRVMKVATGASDRHDSGRGFHEATYRTVDHIKHIHRYPG